MGHTKQNTGPENIAGVIAIGVAVLLAVLSVVGLLKALEWI